MASSLRLILTVCILTLGRAWGDEPLTSSTRLQFADVATGQRHVETSDTFLKSLSRFDRQVRLKTDGEATEKDLVAFLKGEVLAWDEAGRKSLIESIARIRPKLEPLQLPLPENVTLILMSGKEESNAAYTRGTAIMLPKERVQKLAADPLDRLLLHELFHVLSRNAPELRRDLYRLIGFEVCDPISLPESLADLKLTNPDAPLVDCHIRLTEGDDSYHAAPVLYSSSETYDAATKPPLFKYLAFRLMKIEQVDGRWRPVISNGQPVMIDPAKSKSFNDQIGQNTKYIIHPDEILADNFVHLVMQTEKLPSPQLIEQLRERLKRPR